MQVQVLMSPKYTFAIYRTSVNPFYDIWILIHIFIAQRGYCVLHIFITLLFGGKFDILVD